MSEMLTAEEGEAILYRAYRTANATLIDHLLREVAASAAARERRIADLETLERSLRQSLRDAAFEHDELLGEYDRSQQHIAELEALVQRLRTAAITESYCCLCRKVLLQDSVFFEGHAEGCVILLTPEQALAEKRAPHGRGRLAMADQGGEQGVGKLGL